MSNVEKLPGFENTKNFGPKGGAEYFANVFDDIIHLEATCGIEPWGSMQIERKDWALFVETIDQMLLNPPSKHRS